MSVGLFRQWIRSEEEIECVDRRSASQGRVIQENSTHESYIQISFAMGTYLFTFSSQKRSLVSSHTLAADYFTQISISITEIDAWKSLILTGSIRYAVQIGAASTMLIAVYPVTSSRKYSIPILWTTAGEHENHRYGFFK